MEEPAIFDDTPYDLSIPVFPPINIPEDNLLTEQGVLLGRMLFYEKRLSKDNLQSCASCHQQENGFSDTLRYSIGVEGLSGQRQAMPIVNLGYHATDFFWDGRVELLRNQALFPIQDPLEMNEAVDEVIRKLSEEKTYKDQFIRAFGNDTISDVKIGKALEQFMFSLVSFDSKFDKFTTGDTTLTASENRGRLVFFSEYNPDNPNFPGTNCVVCHNGINFTNNKFMNNGLDSDADFADLGRELVTGNIGDKAKFKVPTLRNISATAPYMHDGRFATLEEVIDHYNEGIHASSTVDPNILNTMTTGLFISPEDKIDLVNFLKTLTDESFLRDDRFSTPF